MAMAMAYYVPPPLIPGALVVTPAIQPPPDFETISLADSNTLDQMLLSRQSELRLEGLAHVFLPKNTPQYFQQDLELIEASLLTLLVNNTEDVLNAYNRDFDWKTTFAMKEWRRLQLLMELGHEHVFSSSCSNALWNLPTNQKLPLYLRKQNSTILFTKTNKSASSYKIETFQASLPSELVMSTVGSLSVTYPQTVDATENADLLCSFSYSQQIRDLAVNEFEASMPKTRKGGQDFTESRDVAEPFLVTELLIGMLGDAIKPDKNVSSAKVKKKVRDTVQWNSSNTPFRRSGLWMSAKVCLHLCLLQEMGEKDAKLTYKLILLRMMCTLCNHRADASPADWDLMHQMLAKVGKRAKKLSEMPLSSSSELVGLKQNILKDAYQTISNIQTKMNFLWSELSSKGDTIQIVNRSNNDFLEDLNHEPELLNEYLSAVIQPIREEDRDGVNDIIPITRWPALDNFMRVEFNFSTTITKADEHLDEELVWLHDLENLELDLGAVEEVSSLELYNLFVKYADRALKRCTKHNEHDPIAFSRVVITLLRFYKVLDEKACKKCPLLREYACGIDTSIFPQLLGLDGPVTLAVVDSLEKYFKARDAAANHPSLIYNAYIHRNTFSIRYAKNNEQMKRMREVILNDTETAEGRKREEVEAIHKACIELEKELMSMEHTYDEEGKHVKKCTRCIREKYWHRKRRSVLRYERPLPKDGNLQWAVVFELWIPQEISCVRDALAIIRNEVLEGIMGVEAGDMNDKRTQQNYGLADKSKISTTWVTNYIPIKEYAIKSIRYPELVQLGSTSKAVSLSHYNKTLDLYISNVEDYIIDNGMNCLFYHKRHLKDCNNSEDPFSFQISGCSEERLYKNLQFCVSDTEHTHNELLAEQYSLNTCLPPVEFLAFGSLRSGHRLQLRNLYKFLSEKSLNIEREPVLAIILQTIWSVNHLEQESRWKQVDFASVPFAQEFLLLLESIINSNSHNWSSPLTIMTAVVITIQILKFNLNKAIRKTCGNLLRKCRQVIDGWVQTVEEQLSLVPAQNPEQKKNEQLFLKARILEMLIAAAFSYDASPTEEDKDIPNYLFSHQDDLNTYLKVLSGLNYYVNVEKIHEKLSPFMQLLLKVARYRIPLNLERHVHHKVEHQWGHSSLVNFVHSNWTKLSGCYSLVKNFCWEKCIIANKQHVYQGRIEYVNQPAHKIHVDLIGGSFLIDSYPPTHLPSSISKNPMFQRYFGAQYGENFKVQRDATTFTTMNRINGKHYSFFQARYNENLVLVCRELEEEENEDDFELNYLELLNSEIFRGVIASPLVENYTHWLNPRNEEVYFRKRITNQVVAKKPDLTSTFTITEPDYKMVRTEEGPWRLIQLNVGKYVMSVNSQGFDLLGPKILMKIEEWRYINILVSTPTAPSSTSNEVLVSASLPRLGLNFNLVRGHLYSVEYPGYYISENQSKGTLVGLQHGILLQKDTLAEVSERKQLILVPHGLIGNGEQRNYHQITVIINEDTLRQPPFFVYEVDTVLKRLKADKNKSAWLYLAALHGATSSCLPDPLTGLTGCEMAVWILQSGLVWSCAPYDFECKKTLRMIQNFAPVREFYPKSMKNMESVNWPPFLPSYAAYDGYSLIVRKLMQESERLQELFISPMLANKQWNTALDNDLHSHTATNLRLRAYLRHQDVYNMVCHLSDKYLPLRYQSIAAKEVTRLIMRTHQESSVLLEMAYLRKNPQLAIPPPASGLERFLISSDPINGNLDLFDLVGNNGNLRNWMTLNIKTDWLKLYKLAVSADEQKLHNQLTIILCTLAYHQEAPKTQLLNLHYISRYMGNTGRSLLVHQLSSDYPYIPKDYLFRIENICKILRATAARFSEAVLPVYTGADWQQNKKMIQADYQKRVEVEIMQVASGIKSIIVNPGFGVPMLNSYFANIVRMMPFHCIRPFDVLPEITYTICEWMRNSTFKSFVTQLDTELNGLYSRFSSEGVGSLPKLIPGIKVDISKKVDESLKITLATYFNPDRMSQKSVPAQIYSSGEFPVDADGPVDTRLILQVTKEAIFEELCQSVVSSELAKCLNNCGLFPRMVPVHILRNLVENEDQLPEEILEHIGAVGVLQTLIKRLNRCIKYEKEGPQMATELERERENKGHENWSPKENPEWLLLELDLNLMIRPIQIQVARQMIHMPDGGNGVMQLNMGEGKTSLIVPMLVSTLADENTLCRVTVLQSIFKTNLDLLSNAIGGLLNRRVYVVPCRRDARIKDYLSKIWQVYKECLVRRGTVLTLAEYRLSPRLMAYEKLLGGNEETVTFGLDLLDLESWLREHCRDILDESDELLSAKYQLIYTTGAQLPLGGGSMRWLTCQNILRLVPSVMHQLWSKFGEKMVEFEGLRWNEYPEQFPACRLLSEKCKEELHELLAEQILKGQGNLLDIIMGEEEYQLTKRFLTEAETTKETHDAVLKLFRDDTERLERILLISGYLRRGILHLALSKRWRVEYGVDYKGRRQMAVPFRAKDVAAERTEFGHPDVGIVLTHLSYYYSGLKDEQLMETFMVLKSAPGPESIYQEWIMDIPEERVDRSIRSYEGVNLRDFKQRTVHLFPVLRKNKKVIDFWLSNKVFPKESKVFPRKIVTTAWDLTYERNKYPTSGFSGTNDCSVLLPLPIKQQDLEELQETNRNMERILQRGENSGTVSLKMGISCREILERVKEDGARVLIDAGALMLELGNEQVANMWLEIDSEIEGVVYFNEKNELLVKVRSAAGATRRMNFRRVKKLQVKDIPLEVSPYRERLDKCGIFLDDQHTRGTDLKFPNGFKGCVTVGSRMKRDKLIQAAMRMRKLGSGHSVSFYLSHEVSNKVKYGGRIKTADILRWVKGNSGDFEKEGLIHWAMAGKNYAQKLAAEDIFQQTMEMQPSCSTGRRLKLAGILGTRCVDEEVVDLQDMYGIHLTHEHVVDLLEKWFRIRREKLEEDRLGFSGKIREYYEAIANSVVAKCQEHIPERTYLANNFDEEQEKELELEPEHEEIRCLRRNKNLKPMEHQLQQDVRDFVFLGKFKQEPKNGKWMSGSSNLSSSSLFPLDQIFNNTSFSGLMQPDAWKKCEIYASNDFTRVVQRSRNKDKVDEFLRPISYIVSLKTWNSLLLLLISPYEANELLTSFRTNKVNNNVKLLMFSPRYFLGQDILLNKSRLQLPSNTAAHWISESTIAPLLVASGSLFFGSMEEQKAYARFLGFIPRPWSSSGVEFEALRRGWILKTGFLLPKYAKLYQELVRSKLVVANGHSASPDENENSNLVPSCLGFTEDPSTMVKGILENRHVFVRDSTHVIQLLNKCAYVKQDNKVENGVEGHEDQNEEEEEEADDKVLSQLHTMKLVD